MTLPVGTILPYGGAAAPAEYLLCYGQAIGRTTYASLFSIIGTIYGSGNGTTTFNLPDLRGRVVAGQDDMGGTSANRLTGQSGGVNGDGLGNTGGAETHTLIIAEMPAHTHGIASASALGGADANPVPSDSGAVLSSSTGGDGAHNNVQPTIILNYIIFTGPETGNYVTEDGADNYVTEDGADNYVTENS